LLRRCYWSGNGYSLRQNLRCRMGPHWRYGSTLSCYLPSEVAKSTANWRWTWRSASHYWCNGCGQTRPQPPNSPRAWGGLVTQKQSFFEPC